MDIDEDSTIPRAAATNINQSFWQQVPYSYTLQLGSGREPSAVIDLENEIELVEALGTSQGSQGQAPSNSISVVPAFTSSQIPSNFANAVPAHSSQIPSNVANAVPAHSSQIPSNIANAEPVHSSQIPSNIANAEPAHNSQTQSTGNVVSAVPLPISNHSNSDDFRERTALVAPTSPDEQGSNSCPICFEVWSNSGPHRISSIHCGHLFGRSCIERWLRQNKKCPQCNCRAKKSQIRNIYANVNKLSTTDTVEKDQALEQLKQEKLLRKNAEDSKAETLLQYQQMKSAFRILEQQQQKQAIEKQACLNEKPATPRKYVMQTSWGVCHKKRARVMCYDSNTDTLVMSKATPTDDSHGYGVGKMSCLDSQRYTQFITIHSNTIRDAAFSRDRNNSLLLTASVDKTLKLTSIQSNTTVLSYSTAAPVWSCAWNTNNNNYVYGGLANGKLCVFDIRNTTGHVKILERNDLCCPLVSLAYVPKAHGSSFNLSGLLACSLQDTCFWENNEDTEFVRHSLNFPQGSYTCLKFERNSRHCLLSQRPSKNFNRTRHTILQLYGSRNQEVQANEGDDGTTSCSSYVVSQCLGGSSQKLLGRSTLFPSPDDKSKLLVCTGDESTKSTIIWDGNTGTHLQSIPNDGGGIVIDVCPFQGYNADFLVCLTNEKVSLYKWR